MELQYRLEKADGYIEAHVTGEWHLEPVYRLIDALVAECRARNGDRLLVDCLQVEISGMVLEFERYLIGGRLGEKLGTLRLAALVPAEHINKFAESVAVSAGAEVLVTADRDEAVGWLLGGLHWRRSEERLILAAAPLDEKSWQRSRLFRRTALLRLEHHDRIDRVLDRHRNLQ